MELVFGDHVLDISRRELRRAGTPLALPPQIFDLLVYLVQNRDRVVSKDDLIEHVWAGRIVSDSAMTTAINAARQAVGDSGAAQAVIRTIHRKGVRFVAKASEEDAGDPHPGPPLRTREGAGLEAPLPQAGSMGAAGGATPLTLPDKPSVAVLPFANLSGDREQEPFADGIVEEIITALSRIRWLLVIARTSTLAYKGRAVDMRRVGRELGVRYVLEGSLRKAANRVRITAQLIEAETGAHVWADRYERELADIFAIQDEITEAMVTAIAPAVSNTEQRRALRKPPESLGAWEAYQRGLAVLTGATDADIAAARGLFERALELDPNFAPAHVMFGQVALNEESRGNRPHGEGQAIAVRCGRQAILLDPDDAGGHFLLSWAATWAGNLAAALDHADRALVAGPSDARAHLAKARALILSGRSAEADPFLRAAVRLSPHDPITRLTQLMLTKAAYQQGNFEEAVAIARRCTTEFPGFPIVYIWLAAALGKLGQIDDAKAALSRAIGLSPSAVAREAGSDDKSLRPEDRANLIDGLHKAGWDG